MCIGNARKKCSFQIVLKSRESRSLNFPALFPKNSLTNYSHAQIVSCHAPKSYEFLVMLCPVQEKFKDNIDLYLWLLAKKNFWIWMLLKFFYATTNVPKNLSVKVQKESMQKKKKKKKQFVFFFLFFFHDHHLNTLHNP